MHPILLKPSEHMLAAYGHKFGQCSGDVITDSPALHATYRVPAARKREWEMCSLAWNNLRSGPILAVLIHFSLTATAKIEPDTNSLTFVLVTARFWP